MAAARSAPHEARAWYWRLLRGAAAQVEVWRTTYFHPLPDQAPAVVDWFRATGLRAFLAPLDAGGAGGFPRTPTRPRWRAPTRPRRTGPCSCPSRGSSSWRCAEASARQSRHGAAGLAEKKERPVLDPRPAGGWRRARCEKGEAQYPFCSPSAAPAGRRGDRPEAEGPRLGGGLSSRGLKSHAPFRLRPAGPEGRVGLDAPAGRRGGRGPAGAAGAPPPVARRRWCRGGRGARRSRISRRGWRRPRSLARRRGPGRAGWHVAASAPVLTATAVHRRHQLGAGAASPATSSGCAIIAATSRRAASSRPGRGRAGRPCAPSRWRGRERWSRSSAPSSRRCPSRGSPRRTSPRRRRAPPAAPDARARHTPARRRGGG